MKIPKAVQDAIASDPHLVDYFRNRVVDDLDKLYNALRDRALGVWVREMTLTGEERVYREKPDFAAGSYLVNHAVGSPMKKVQISTQHTFSYEGRLEQLREERNRAIGAPKPPENVVEGEFSAVESENPPSRAPDAAQDRLEALKTRLLAEKRAEERS